MIGILIGIPFQLYIFRAEINYHITKMIEDEQNTIKYQYEEELAKTKKRHETDKEDFADNRDRLIESAVSELDLEGSTIAEEITKLDQEIADKGAKVECERNGKCGTGMIGPGPVTDELEREKNRLLEALAAAKLRQDKWLDRREQKAGEAIEPLEINRKELEDSQKEELTALQDRLTINQQEVVEKYPKESLLTLYLALERLRKANTSARLASLFITLFFIFVEMAPILAKALAGGSIHDLLAHRERIEVETQTKSEEARLSSWLAQEKAKREGERTKIENEWTAFREAYQSFLGRFRQAIEDQVKKTFEEWTSRFKTEAQQQQMHSHFGEHFEQLLKNFKEFGTAERASKPPPSSPSPEPTAKPRRAKGWGRLRKEFFEAAMGSLTPVIFSILLLVFRWLFANWLYFIPLLLLAVFLGRRLRWPKAAQEGVPVTAST
jgi:hypothetical protein